MMQRTGHDSLPKLRHQDVAAAAAGRNDLVVFYASATPLRGV